MDHLIPPSGFRRLVRVYTAARNFIDRPGSETYRKLEEAVRVIARWKGVGRNRAIRIKRGRALPARRAR